MVTKYTVLILLVLSLCVTASGETYYVSVRGSDANSGLDWDNAWRDADYTNGRISCGDTVLFGDGAYDDCLIFPPANCDTEGPQTVYACSSFAEGTEAAQMSGLLRAEIRGGYEVTDWVLYSGSIYRGDHVMEYDFAGEDVGCLVQDTFGLIRENSLAAVNAEGEFYADPSGDVYVWPHNSIDPNDATWFAASSPAVWYSAATQGYGKTNHVKFWGLKFRYGKPAPIATGNGFPGPYGMIIERCDLRYGGATGHGNPGASISANGEHSPGPMEYLVVRACTIGYAFDGVRSGQTNEGGIYDEAWDHGGGMVLYGVQNAIIDSNVFIGHCNAGIIVKQSRHDYNSWNNNIMHNEFTSVPHRSISSGHTDAINLNSNPGYDTVVGNYVGFPWANGVVIEGTGTYCEYNEFVCNNTFVGLGTYDGGKRGAALSMKGAHGSDAFDCGTDNVFKYNLIAYTELYDGAYYHIGFRQEDGKAGCEHSTLIDSNMWYDSTGTTFQAMCNNTADDFQSSSLRTWAEWIDSSSSCLGTWAGDMNSWNTVHPDFYAAFDSTLSLKDRFSRPNCDTNEMNLTHSGRTWTKIGAWQGGLDTALIQSLRTQHVSTDSFQVVWRPSFNEGTVTDLYCYVSTFSPPTDQIFYDATPDQDSVIISATSLSENTTYYIRTKADDDSTTNGYSGILTQATDAEPEFRQELGLFSYGASEIVCSVKVLDATDDDIDSIVLLLDENHTPTTRVFQDDSTAIRLKLTAGGLEDETTYYFRTLALDDSVWDSSSVLSQMTAMLPDTSLILITSQTSDSVRATRLRSGGTYQEYNYGGSDYFASGDRASSSYSTAYIYVDMPTDKSNITIDSNRLSFYCDTELGVAEKYYLYPSTRPHIKNYMGSGSAAPAVEGELSWLNFYEGGAGADSAWTSAGGDWEDYIVCSVTVDGTGWVDMEIDDGHLDSILSGDRGNYGWFFVGSHPQNGAINYDHWFRTDHHTTLADRPEFMVAFTYSGEDNWSQSLAATGVTTSAMTIQHTWSGGVVDSTQLYFGTNNPPQAGDYIETATGPPTSPHSFTEQTGLSEGTRYYFSVVPYIATDPYASSVYSQVTLSTGVIKFGGGLK